MPRGLFDVGQQVVQPSAGLILTKASISVAHPVISPAAGRVVAVGAFVVHAAQGELLEVVLAGIAAGRLAGRLHRREQQRDEDSDDRDHDQKFDQRETSGR